jgi:hypothetical protein
MNIPFDNEQIAAKCFRCKKSWCVKCRNDAHMPNPCGKITTKFTDTESLILAVRTMVERVIDDVGIHKCPKCFTKYEKTDGCNFMTCSSCHSYSCFICGIILLPKNGKKYWHFKGHTDSKDSKDSLCQLYTDKEMQGGKASIAADAEFNMKNIIVALENLVNINLDNPEIALLIYMDIISKKFQIKSYPQLDAAELKKRSNANKKQQITGQEKEIKIERNDVSHPKKDKKKCTIM